MAQVPVDIKVDIDGLGAFRKLERNFKRLEKLTSDLLVKLNTATAERQLRGLDRDVNRLKKSAGNVVVGFNVDRSGLRNAKRELEGVSAGGGAGGAGLIGVAAGASAASGISKAGKDLAAAVKPLESAIEKVKENVKQASISTGKFKEGLQESKNISRQLARINQQVENGWNEITQKTRQYQAAIQEIKRIDGFRRRLTQNEVELRAKSVVEAKELFAELKKATRQQDKLGDSLARYQRLAAQPSGRFQAPGLP